MSEPLPECMNDVCITCSDMAVEVTIVRLLEDQMAVVDNELRVHGIQGLRVADASIMPTLTSGNTNAPSIMIGEKGADLVLKAATARQAA